MSGYRGHIVGGMVSLALLFFIIGFPLPLLACGIPIAAFYSILPDADIPSSMARRIIHAVFFFGIFASAGYTVLTGNTAGALIALFLVLPLLLMARVHHRGMIHTHLAGIILSTPLLYFGFHLFLIGYAAWVSHLFLDGEFFKFLRNH